MGPATFAGAQPAPGSADAQRDAYVADKRGLMTTLGGWSLGSLGVGAAMWAAGDTRVRFAGIQNVAWGAIDGAIAAYALWSDRDEQSRVEPAAHWAAERQKLRTVLWINVGLDVAYVVTGIALSALGKTDALRGSGAGVIAQGGFLLVFDTAGALVIGR